ncbi:hypothetical protein [Streptomyces gossypiisoli]|uniref:hypothetical protein n=1 Tax=Streptomyces gossypiisoli TaxID=2748864 RepID=UPI0015DA3315|nr:hypothetical protein [Streptomyces gossypiisoli]
MAGLATLLLAGCSSDKKTFGYEIPEGICNGRDYSALVLEFTVGDPSKEPEKAREQRQDIGGFLRAYVPELTKVWCRDE